MRDRQTDGRAERERENKTNRQTGEQRERERSRHRQIERKGKEGEKHIYPDRQTEREKNIIKYNKT